ncbi:SusC/RagA family TonB-linked outer membrane protein [Marinoscillum furvescens]|uniref:TonB-linked SusC/RagA family outer membrane protein n=1 Tax=Marinoscillum furvescens DSM 4134 TaxID=1122208 RepID=A0A3D9KZC9_MARFU|nr:TonB-dependent receptor [Marinoscillum furvescens]RED95266.1 TonB-linked SusC/RagA family outer membrane protein [Marinoscillum furvescens DSM 4134]
MSKIAIYAVIMSYSLTMAFGHESVAQRKFLSEINLEVTLQSKNLLELLDEIEQSSEFHFAYSKKDLKGKKIVITSGKWNMESLLKEISVQARVSLKRVNETITIKKVSETDRLPDVLEKLSVQKTVTGRVVDENGEGLPGATVAVKGTSIGTITDIDGNFRLDVEEGTTLVFSFVGYQSREVPVTDQSVYNISLELDTQGLEEIVVIGYQTVQKKDLTGATSVIDPSASSKVTATTLAESIQGLAPGVTVRNDGAPGAGAIIEIRGVGSFADTQPLYVIDGMLADANPTINTNDIASIQILKDASAAAIYGSRAANGVVIITTKQGEEGPVKVNVSAKTGLQQIAKRWDVMNAQEFAAMQTSMYENSGLTPPASVGVDFDPAIDTDWQDEMIQWGKINDYNVSLSGGSLNNSFMISGSAFNNEGVLKGRSFERYSLRLNSKSKIGRVTVGENMVLTHSINESPDAGNPFYDMPQLLPVIPVRGEDYITESNPEGWGIGTVDAVTYAWNPVAINNLSHNTAKYSKLVGNAFLDFKLTDWIKYRFNAGLEVSFDDTKYLREDGVWSFNAAVYPSYVEDTRSTYASGLLEHTLNINKDFGRHSISAVLGTSQQSFRREFTTARRSELQVINGEYLPTIASATGEDVASGGRPVDSYIIGYLGRVNYSFADRYLLTLTGRIDKNSKFKEEYRTGFFPSVAMGWRLSEEGFFNVPFVSNMKLTASYGEIGLVPGAIGSWDYIGNLNSNPRAIFGNSQAAYVGAYQPRLINEKLQWETKITRNVGLDLGMMADRLLVSLAYYNSVSDQAILNPPVANYFGTLGGNPFVNTGSLRNQGFEFSATYRKREGDFNWDLSGNFTTIKNTVESVGNQGVGIDYIPTGLTRTKVGRSISEWYLLKTDGLFQTPQDVLDHTNSEGQVIQPNAQPGDIRFVDVNDDGQITEDDRDFSGKSAWPTLQVGSQFNASYRNFNLNVQVIGVFGNYIYNSVRQILDGYQNTNFRSDIQPWTEENPNTSDPRIGVASNDVALAMNGQNSDRWLESGSYLRLRNVEFGYNFESSLLETIGVASARVFISGQNLLTLTQYSGLDPDVTGNGIYERGADTGNWPSNRVYSTGIQFQF